MTLVVSPVTSERFVCSYLLMSLLTSQLILLIIFPLFNTRPTRVKSFLPGVLAGVVFNFLLAVFTPGLVQVLSLRSLHCLTRYQHLLSLLYRVFQRALRSSPFLPCSLHSSFTCCDFVPYRPTLFTSYITRFTGRYVQLYTCHA